MFFKDRGIEFSVWLCHRPFTYRPARPTPKTLIVASRHGAVVQPV